MSRHSGDIRKCWPAWYFKPPRRSVVIDVDEIPRLRMFQDPRGQAGRAVTRGVGVHVQAPGLAVVDTRGDAAASGGPSKSALYAYPPEHDRAFSGSGRRRRSVPCNKINGERFIVSRSQGIRFSLALLRTLRRLRKMRQRRSAIIIGNPLPVADVNALYQRQLAACRIGKK